jgi:hypothetical protein
MLVRELKGLSMKLKNTRLGTFIVGVMVIRRILFHLRAVWAAQKTSSNIFLQIKRKLCHAR